MYDPALTILRAVLSLCATLGLIVLCGWVWRTYGQNWNWPRPAVPPARRLQVLETRRLNQHTTLHLVRLDHTELLLATTAAQTTLITSLNPATPAGKSAKVKP